MMELKGLQDKVDEYVKKHGGYWSPLSILARLMEEVGELARNVNIKYGEKKKKYEEDGGEVDDEIIDVLVTTVAMANSLGIDLEEKFMKKINKDVERNKGVYFK